MRAVSIVLNSLWQRQKTAFLITLYTNQVISVHPSFSDCVRCFWCRICC